MLRVVVVLTTLGFIGTLDAMSDGGGAGTPPPASAVPEWARVSKEQIAEAARLEVPVAFEDARTTLRYVLIPGGRFLMGSPGYEPDRFENELPQHTVTVPAYFLATTEVTNAQFERFVAGTGYRTTAEKEGMGYALNPEAGWVEAPGTWWREPLFGKQRQSDWTRHPVVQVSWDDAKAYVAWAQARLPSEAEAEYALRGGRDGENYPWGDAESPPAQFANYGGEELKRVFPKIHWAGLLAADDGFPGTAPVASFPADRFGLYDISGNVWEWCEDDWHADYVGAPTDGSAWVDHPRVSPRVARGAGWVQSLRLMRCAFRLRNGSSGRDCLLGLRPARPVKPAPPSPPIAVGEPPRPGAGAVPEWARVSPEQVAEAAHLKVPVAYEEPTTGLRFVLIPGGTFMMGCADSEEGRLDGEGPQHQVTLQAFYLSVFETTNRQYRLLMGDHRSGDELDDDAQPVVCVKPYEASRFAARLPRTNGGYHLPSESQWEYACRAGTSTRFSFGQELTKEQANFGNNVGKPTPVGSYKPNSWGLYDMHGNVQEWCADDSHDDYSGAPADGSAWIDGSDAVYRVVRGGSWPSPADYLRSGHRNGSARWTSDPTIGFRVGRSILPR